MDFEADTRRTAPGGGNLTAPHDNYDPETGLLSAEGFEGAIEEEISRASRHERPLAVIYIEICGAGVRDRDGADLRALALRAAESLLGRVRSEDRVARLGPLKFAVVAAEAGDGVALAERLAAHVDKHLASGSTAGALTVAAGAADAEYDELSKDELVQEAEKGLATAILEGEQIPFPPGRAPVGETRITG